MTASSFPDLPDLPNIDDFGANAPTASPRRRKRRGWLARLYRFSRLLCALGAIAAATLVGAAVVGAWVGATWARVAIPLFFAVLIPCLARWSLRRRLSKRFERRLSLGGQWLYVAWNAGLVALLCLGFSGSTGRALRRRGDFWLGAAEGPLAAAVRQRIASAGRWMERFDTAAELKALAQTKTQPDPSHPASAGSGNGSGSSNSGSGDGSSGNGSSGDGSGGHVASKRARWVHPLPGPRRRMPPNASCRFGARRSGSRPAECQLGHCGVDLAGPVGLPVLAIADSVVKSVVREAERGGIAGRYVILFHRGRAIKSKYIHLHTIRADLRRGQTVRAGERIGTLGRSGFRYGGAHLHFAVAVRRGARWHYIDPEPMLYVWQLASDTRRPRRVAQR